MLLRETETLSWLGQGRRGDEMAIEDRIRHMLRVAARAEREGNLKMAELFRRMAREARPAEPVEA
jgi:hypothetical protein